MKLHKESFIFRKTMVLMCLILVLTVAGCRMKGITREAVDEKAAGPFSVGYTVINIPFQKQGKDKPIAVAVWYPTRDEPRIYSYGGSVSGMVAFDGPLREDKGPYPLIVFSHGIGGGGTGSVFFTEHLASMGWIVAAPDHGDPHPAVRIREGLVKGFSRTSFLKDAKTIESSGPSERGRFLYRLEEMKAVLNHMLENIRFGTSIDRNRIAVGGHSFGGFTALGLCGAIPDYHDPRIKAVLLFSTGAGSYLYTEDELKKVRMPSMIFMGEKERYQTRGKETMLDLVERLYRCMDNPSYFLEIKGGNHFSFNNGFGDGISNRMLSGSEDQFSVIRRFSIAFLEKHVASNKAGDTVLEKGDFMLTRYLRK